MTDEVFLAMQEDAESLGNELRLVRGFSGGVIRRGIADGVESREPRKKKVELTRL